MMFLRCSDMFCRRSQIFPDIFRCSGVLSYSHETPCPIWLVGGWTGLNDPQLLNTWEVFVSRHFWVPVNPHIQRVRNVWQRGVGSKKCLVMGNFQSVPRYRKRTDQKPPITRHFWPPTPLCHTYSEPSGYEDSPGPPVHGSKMHPEMPGNKYFSSFRQLWVIKSPP